MPKNTTNYPDLSALVVFFEKWKALHPPLAEKLQAFFQKWPGYIPTENQMSEQPPIAVDHVLSLVDFFGSFPSAIKARKSQGARMGLECPILEICGGFSTDSKTLERVGIGYRSIHIHFRGHWRYRYTAV